MTDDSEFSRMCSYHSEKCRQHLNRTKLSRQLALDQLNSGEDVLSDHRALIECSIDEATGDVRGALATVITKTHFLLLKVNFEYYLNRMSFCVWNCHFDALITQHKTKLLDKYEYRLKEFAVAVTNNRAKEYIIGKIVPSHGLTSLEKVLENTTGVSLSRELNHAHPKRRPKIQYWPQIHSAFDVRHLIEHTNARTDEKFMADVCTHPLWKNSSWGKLPLSCGDEIPIRATDFDDTFLAMLEATRILEERLKGFSPMHG